MDSVTKEVYESETNQRILNEHLQLESRQGGVEELLGLAQEEPMIIESAHGLQEQGHP